MFPSRSHHVKRSARRVSVESASRLRHGDFRLTEVQLTNLSFGGFCARCAVELEPGDYVSIDLPDIGLVRARVAWCHSGYVGGTFSAPIDIRRCFDSAA